MDQKLDEGGMKCILYCGDRLGPVKVCGRLKEDVGLNSDWMRSPSVVARRGFDMSGYAMVVKS